MRGTVDCGRLRQVLGHVPTSLAVVSTMDGPDPVGCTVGSFVSVSLEPPLVGYFAMEESWTLRAIRHHGAFSVNVLAEDQADLADRFSRPFIDRFGGTSWRPGAGGCPHLDGALIVVDCDLDGVLTVGDHEMVVGRVTVATARRPGVDPLVFARGRFHGYSKTHQVRLDQVARPA